MIRGALKGCLVAFIISVLGLHFQLIEFVQPYIDVEITTEFYYFVFAVLGAVFLSKK